MNEEIFNLELRKFLKKFGITAQREIEKSVLVAIESGTLVGSETLEVSARLQIEGLTMDVIVSGKIALA